jgi:hypothetical protein
MSYRGESNGHTSATVTSAVKLSGKVATMGQGVLQDVSGRLVDVRAEPGGDARGCAGTGGDGANIARETAPAEPQDALDLGSLGGAVVADRLKDPKTLAGVVLLVLALVFLLGRHRR